MIKVEHLYKGFEGKQVLRDINVNYEAGKCNMIIGASGSGKTVLLKFFAQNSPIDLIAKL